MINRLRHLRPALLAPLAIAFGLACNAELPTGAEPDPATGKGQQGLIGGTVDSDDPGVVALTRGGTSSFCTGTLVSPRVILTAAHCIDMLGTDPNAAIYFGSDTRGEGIKITVRAKKQHPMWTGDLNGGHDVGMLLMDFPYEDPDAAHVLNTSPALQYVGEDYRHVGFGVFDRATGQADGQKRTGTTTIDSLRDDVIISGDAEVSVCFGDSGGPAFLTIDGQEVVAGIHSFTTSDDCFPPNGDTNVQLYAEDFILPWIQDNDPSCGLDGVCGAIGCVDDPDCQPCGPDGTCVQDCELPDPDCTTQGLGDICRANSQCTTDLCVAYRPEREYSFCAEPCDPGNDSCPDGMSCQDIIPLGNICYYDSDPPGILGDECQEGADCGSYNCTEGVCVIPCDLSVGLTCPDDFACETHNDGEDYLCYGEPKESGGCGIGGGSSSAGWCFVFLGLWLVRRRRG